MFKTSTGGATIGIAITGTGITGTWHITIIGLTGTALITTTTAGGGPTITVLTGIALITVTTVGGAITGITAIGAAGDKRLWAHAHLRLT